MNIVKVISKNNKFMKKITKENKNELEREIEKEREKEKEKEKEKETEQENKIKEEEDFKKKLEENQLKIMTEFKGVKLSYSDYIMSKIKHHKRTINNSVKVLYGKEKDEKNTNNFIKMKKLKILQTSKSALELSDLSQKAKRLSQKINYHVDKIKKSHEDLTALNSLYLDNSLFPKRIKNYYTKDINSNSQDKNNYIEAIRKKNLRNNFDFVSRNYHKQLNLAFMKYNPLIYSNNLKMLLQVSPAIRDDVSKTKLEIEGDIKTMKDKHLHAKIFKQIKTTKYSRSKSIDYFELNRTKHVDSKNTEIKNGPILPNIEGNKSPENKKENIKSRNIILQRINKRESKKNLAIFNKQNEDDNILFNISREIEKYMKDDNIRNKIDNHLQDYNHFKYMSLFNKKEENKNSVFKPKDYYYLQKEKINRLFEDLYVKQLKNKTLEEERIFGNKLRMKRNSYFNKMTFDMKSSLGDLDNYISNNGINLDENQEEKL